MARISYVRISPKYEHRPHQVMEPVVGFLPEPENVVATRLVTENFLSEFE